MATLVENWDDDVDFQGDFHTLAGQSVGTAHTSISSRLSVHSESAAGDDDWNVVLQSNDQQATNQAIQSAKQAGIPLPSGVPTSALLGGAIKRLGKKKSRQKVADDWDADLEMPDGGALQLKQRTPALQSEEVDDFEDLEGSLGIRFGGTKREVRNRSSSTSAMSPSMGSGTAESDEDELKGLELPDEPMDFDAILKKRRAAEAELSDVSQASPAVEQSATMNVHKRYKILPDEGDDFMNDFDFAGGEILDNRRRAVNRNLKLKAAKPALSTQRPATTINFHDKPTDKPVHMRSHLPRPVSGSKPTSRLEPVLESGASHVPRERRQATTTSAQLLRSKRSMPVLRSQPLATAERKPHHPFASSGLPSYQSPSVSSTQRAMPYHLRRDSDPNNRGGAQSPPPARPTSRLSTTYTPDTPSRGPRQRPDLAPAALAREAAARRTVTKPARRRNYGDGNELEIFDDLPTSSTKESKFVKQPVARGPPKLGLRQTQSRVDIREAGRRNFAAPERMMTPAPPRTPASPTKGFPDATINTPSYLRDTAASRRARESRTNNVPRPRSEGPLMPLNTNWKAQVAARSPFTSPNAQRSKSKRSVPTLIKNMSPNVVKTEKGMVYNPQTLRWDGNENTLSHFEILPPLETPTPAGNHPVTSYMDHHHAPSSSPPRPALIAPMSAAVGVQVNGGMVFDPRQMKWLKLKEGRDLSGPLSPSITDGDEDDAFAGIEDLKDETSPALGPGSLLDPSGGMASPISMVGAPVTAEVHEEFDLGPVFIQRQREAEVVCRRRCESWFPDGEPRFDDGRWRWDIRAMLPQEGFDML